MTDYKNPRLIVDTSTLEPGKISWRSPSNLALIKYWGKYGRQLPRNPSISFTLDNAYTETHVEYRPKRGADEGIALEFFFGDEPREDFRVKVLQFLESIVDIFPFLRQLDLTIRSFNSFPHSAGIASSASSMSALSLCLCSLEDRFFGTLRDDQAYRQKASFVARLGSGSASRSIYSTMAVWGESSEVPGSSNLFAVPYERDLHEVFKTFHDDILIVSKGEKSVSSRAGHGLMEGNPYAEPRYEQARQRMLQLLGALRQGDLEVFGRITENEAMTLHALMMCSNPSYVLMEPNSLALIRMVRAYRHETGHPLYFSLDAGPNLHLLYPDAIHSEVQTFIKDQLSPFCEHKAWIADRVGEGPLQL
ncbi:MAG: diphosphomevalonate decarboxylase [Bacteroidota bacterium]